MLAANLYVIALVTPEELRLIWRRLIENDGEANDFSVSDTEVVRHDQLLGKVRLVVFAVVGCSNNCIAVMVDDVETGPTGGSSGAKLFEISLQRRTTTHSTVQRRTNGESTFI